MTDADFAFCNCLPSGCNCLQPLVPTCGVIVPPMCDGTNYGTGRCQDPTMCSSSPTCNSTSDLFCQVAIRAVSSGVESSNFHSIEYGR